jgi:hypothetical protein
MDDIIELVGWSTVNHLFFIGRIITD